MTTEAPRTGKEPRSIAVVSGKGGSGKTLISVGLAQLLSELGVEDSLHQVLLMDGDNVTAGLSYYLSQSKVAARNGGLFEFARAASAGEERQALWPLLHPIGTPDLASARWAYLPVGSHDRLMREIDQQRMPELLALAVERLAELGKWLIVDCRGGIDEESLAICKQVDEIILVVEPDVSSVQTARHLVNVLTVERLNHKLGGFIINKALEDPSVFTEAALFASPCLATVPFDIDTARSTLVGTLPTKDSLFLAHLAKALPHISAQAPKATPGTLPRHEFTGERLRSPEVIRGARVLSFLFLVAAAALVLRAATSNMDDVFFIWSIVGLALLGSATGSWSVRRLIGNLLGRIRPKDA